RHRLPGLRHCRAGHVSGALRQAFAHREAHADLSARYRHGLKHNRDPFMSERSTRLKHRLRAGETTFGAWLTVANPVIAEIMAGAGFDWVLIDTEHGGFGDEGLQTCLIAFNGSPTVPMVRVGWNDHVMIKRALD